MGLTDDWADKMAGQEFLARNAKSTFEHYLQVMIIQRSTVQKVQKCLLLSHHPMGLVYH